MANTPPTTNTLVNAGGTYILAYCNQNEAARANIDSSKEKDQEGNKRVKVELPPYFSIQQHCPPRLMADYALGGYNYQNAEEMLNEAILSTCRCYSTPCRLNQKETFKVLGFYRIENTALFERYSRYVDNAKCRLQFASKTKERFDEISEGLPAWLRRLAKRNINEEGSIYALHGTRPRNLKSILENGLQTKYVNRGNNFYGNGIYFADKACKANQYTCEDKGFILVCRVFIGKTQLLHTMCKNKNAPHKDYNSAWAKKGHTTINGYTQLHNEFIIFKDQACYPEFVIHFRKKRPGVIEVTNA